MNKVTFPPRTSLSCVEFPDAVVPWKKISRGLPKTRRFAAERALSLDEVGRIARYSDRSIKPVVYSMYPQERALKHGNICAGAISKQ
jgi:hypothetical protein